MISKVKAIEGKLNRTPPLAKAVGEISEG